MYSGIRLLLLIHPFISSIFFLSNFQYWNFLSHFSRELWGLKDWNFVHTWTVGRCIMYSRIRLLLLIPPFISSFFFLSNFQHWNFSSHLSRELWGLEDWKLVDSGQMYHVYQNQAASAYSSLYFFIFLSLQFSTLKFFITFFSRTVRPRRSKLGTHRQWADVYCILESGCCFLFIPLFLHFSFSPIFKHLSFSSHLSQELWGLEDGNLVHMWIVGRCMVYTVIRLLLLICFFISSFFFLSNYQTLKIFVTFFSGTVRSKRLKLGTLVDSGQMYRVYRNQAAALICPFISSFFFLSNFQTLKFFVTLFSWTVRRRRLKLGTHVDSGQMYRVYRNQAAAAYSSFISSFSFSPIFKH